MEKVVPPHWQSFLGSGNGNEIAFLAVAKAASAAASVWADREEEAVGGNVANVEDMRALDSFEGIFGGVALGEELNVAVGLAEFGGDRVSFLGSAGEGAEFEGTEINGAAVAFGLR